MKKNILIVLSLILCLSAIFVFAGCKKDSNGGVDTVVIDMSLEDAQKKATDAGCTPVVITVYDENKDDGAILSIGEFMKDAKEGDYITICVNDLSIKETIKAMPLAPRVIPADSFETKILANAGDASSRLNAYYTKSESNYVLDPGASEQNITTISEAVEAAGYTADDMFNDYVTVGIIPVPSDALKAEVLTNDNAKFTETNGQLTVTEYIGTSKNVVIPSEVDSKPVTAIAKDAFKQYDLHAVTTMDNLTTIESGAFSNAYSLINVSLSSTVMDIGKNAFTNPLFTDINGDFTTYADVIALTYTGSDTEVTVPDGIKYLAPELFSKNKNMTKVDLPDTLLSIGDNAFSGCEVLADVTLPEGLLAIGTGAFSQARAFTAISLPSTLLKVGDSAFKDCTGVKEINLNDGLKTIGSEAFVYCFYTETNDITATLNIPSSVEYIGNYAFQKCSGLTEVTGGEGISYLGHLAFAETPWYISFISGKEFAIFNGVLINYSEPKDFDGTVVLPADVKGISGAFENAKSTTKIVVNDGCTFIADQAFLTVAKLTELTIPASVTNIGAKILTAENASAITVHCEAGSAAEEYAKANFHTIDNNM